MTNDGYVENERNYSFNWVSLLIRIVIFAILLVALIWILSKFTGNGKCKTITKDYYVITSFNDDQYNSNNSDGKYIYNYTLKLLDINKDNSKGVSIKNNNFFHGDDEYDDYLKYHDDIKIINQTSDELFVEDAITLRDASLTAGEFTYDLSDVYVYDGEYYIDVVLNIGEHSNISSYSNNYFVPIHLSIEYTQTDNCKN